MTDLTFEILRQWAKDETTPIPSPCIRVCKVDEDRDLCVGCYRTRAELRAWMGGSNATRAAIIEAVIARRIKLGTAGQPDADTSQPAPANA